MPLSVAELSDEIFGADVMLDFIIDLESTREDADEALGLIISSLGILVGFSWEQSFDGGVEVVALRTRNPLVTELALACAVVCLVLPAWRRHILDKVIKQEGAKGRHAPPVAPSEARKGGEKVKGAAAMIQSKLEYAIASHSTDWGSAMEALDACVEKNEGLDLLSVAMTDCIQQIKNSPAKAKHMEELSSGAASRLVGDLEAPLRTCHLEKKLETAIRSAWTTAYDE
eukprot:Skav221960  [mRNA]  locus=scaffold195:706644:715770:- [translate_table: standard]